MILYINGQDITRIALGFQKDASSESIVEVFDASPEEYLARIDAFLKAQGAEVKAVTHVAAVAGPGSATALRTSLSIVNTIQFVQNVFTLGIEKETDEQDSDSFKKAAQDMSVFTKGEFLYPMYTNDPKITKSKKDALGRRVSDN